MKTTNGQRKFAGFFIYFWKLIRFEALPPADGTRRGIGPAVHPGCALA